MIGATCNRDGQKVGEPPLERVERVGVGLVAVCLARVGDDDRPVLPVGCTARGGFDSDVGGDANVHEGVDACHAENRVERRVNERAARLSPYDRFIVTGGRCRRWDRPQV